jgi:hypothetical protein
MQEPPIEQGMYTGTSVAGMEEFLSVAQKQTEALLKILQTLQTGTYLSLATWGDAYAASHRILGRINIAITLAEEVFERHVVLVPGFVSEDMICDEFKCLTWK